VSITCPTVHGAGLAKRRPDVAFNAELGETPHVDWKDVLK